MPQSLTRILLHIIFSTKKRQPWIDDNIAPHLHEYIGGICSQQGCQPIAVGGYTDQIHILSALSRKIAVMDLVEKIKTGSSKWIKTKAPEYEGFHWQDGYAAFSVSPLQSAEVISYIKNQKTHHKSTDFLTESRMFYNRYGIEWNEKYAWD